MSRGKEVIRDPAVAAAAAKCWLARQGGKHFFGEGFHPEKCSLCDYEPEYLMDMIREFLDWSGLRADKQSAPLRAEVEGFLTLPPEEQARAVRAVQYE